MPLSCSCGEWDGEGAAWYCPTDFCQFMGTWNFKRRRCCSCKKLIDIGSPCIKFKRFRMPITDIECKIYGEGNEIDLADWFMCESCGEIFLNLDAIGYCIDIEHDKMTNLLKEYQEMTGFKQV